jgi:hypothetical protein
VNWTDLEDGIYAEGKDVFERLQRAHPDEQFYAFSLYTDSDGITVCPAAISTQGLVQILQAAEVEPGSQDAAYYKWATAEWPYEYWDAQAFNDICTRLREEEENEDLDAFVAHLVKAMTNALARLREEGVFKHGADGAPILFVSMSDDDRAEEIEDESAKTLNTPDAYARFAARYGEDA